MLFISFLWCTEPVAFDLMITPSVVWLVAHVSSKQITTGFGSGSGNCMIYPDGYCSGRLGNLEETSLGSYLQAWVTLGCNCACPSMTLSG